MYEGFKGVNEAEPSAVFHKVPLTPHIVEFDPRDEGPDQTMRIWMNHKMFDLVIVDRSSYPSDAGDTKWDIWAQVDDADLLLQFHQRTDGALADAALYAVTHATS